MKEPVKIIGGGLAGSEAALYLANKGILVELYEMRPVKTTPIHKTGYLAELVCSNSLGSLGAGRNASGVLKEEMIKLGSTLLTEAFKNSVPAGDALAVDRELFARRITELIESHPKINLVHEHVHDIHIHVHENAEQLVLIATGPLTSEEFATSLIDMTDRDYLHFYDAVAPIIEFSSIDMSIAYKLDRYKDAESSSYINCPMNEEQYEAFYQYLINSPTIELKEFEKGAAFFESCMPIEVIAKSGKETLRFGPMKPVGLPDPRTGEIPYAAVQLRQDNAVATLYNLVGFQTNLKWSAQEQLIKLIPGLKDASIVRYGVMHRNTYINSPLLIKPTLEAGFRPGLFFAGQLIGVEGYTESMATGLLAAINIYRKINNLEPLILEDISVLGALCHYITTADSRNFQPMNANWGIIRPAIKKIRNKKQRCQHYSKRALDYIDTLSKK